MSAPGAFFRRFAAAESTSGALLLAFTVAALAWANSPWGGAYQAFRDFAPPLLSGHAPHFTLSHFVNDALMALFFLVVGLEIKRELRHGELSSPRKAALPFAGALGGMLLPALLYTAWNAGGPAAAGWGIPMATDIAFALAVLTLLGSRVPSGLKAFLVGLAILDDIGAILVIAVFYTAQIHLAWLATAAAIIALLAFANRRGVTHPAVYLAGGAVLWLALFNSGIHATLAGVALALCIPGPTARRLESGLHPWVSFGILPLFALVNAGVPLTGAVTGALTQPMGLGILTGLLLGKPVGITLFSWAAVRAGAAQLPAQTSWAHLWGAGLLGGIGFTMSLFIAGLGLPPEWLDGARISVLAASLTAGAAGWALLRTRAAAPAVKEAA